MAMEILELAETLGDEERQAVAERIAAILRQAAARKALDTFVAEKNSGNWHLIVLDEVNVAVSLGLITIQEVLDAVTDFPEDRILILSGRNAPQEFIDIADLATEMKEIKH